MKYDCIVIGAGAAGLISCNELARAGRRVLLLEACDRAGGRICTFNRPGFSRYIESGAEFIHGDLPVTSSLLRKANVRYSAMEGETYQIENGNINKHDFFNKELTLIMGALKKLKNDMPFSEFLRREFPIEKYLSLNHNIQKFVEGYNAADIRLISALALKKEWEQDDDPTQYRPEGGYETLVNFLVNENRALGVAMEFSKVVAKISWKAGEAALETTGRETYQAAKVIITVPIGVLQANALTIIPAIPEYFTASKKIGFGSVIKFIMQIRENFWHREMSKRFPSFKFIFTDAIIPTWWSQLPDNVPILTGWLGGPSAEGMAANEEYLSRLAVDCLADIVNCSADVIRQQLTAFHVENWKKNP